MQWLAISSFQDVALVYDSYEFSLVNIQNKIRQMQVIEIAVVLMQESTDKATTKWS